jgi:pimeloyl-ACP methyl ester carboxylesterase
MDGVTTMVPVGRHRLETTVFGSGEPVVVVEPSLGGFAAAWREIAETVAEDTTVVTYNRAPYGASSPARDGRTPRDIADDLDGVLNELGVRGPLVLVGHSIGGIYLRTYAALHMDRVAGMVLVDSSHETQGKVVLKHLSPKNRVIAALTVPQLIVRSREWRGGGDRRSCVREFRMFKRLSAADQALAGGALGGRPLIVVTRGPVSKTKPDRLWEAWYELQRDLAGLSANSRHMVSGSPDHYLNEGDPDLVVSAIRDVVRSARTGTPLAETAEPPAASDASDASEGQ